MPLDVFKSVRNESRTFKLSLGNETIPMLLSYNDVRNAAKNWHTFSSDAKFRVPIPSEEKVRTVRQLPIEIDPPKHKEYRKLVEPFFRQPHNPDYITRIDNLIGRHLSEFCKKGATDVVRELALPIQSRSLTYLLNLPESEADTWIRWGTHVFRDGIDPSKKGLILESYILHALDSTRDQANKVDIFSHLLNSAINGRTISQEEILGIVNLIFAGGRDTLINAISYLIHYFAENRSELLYVASNPELTNLAVEEFIRVLSPLTHIGRVCTSDVEIGKCSIKQGTRVSLCWAAANYDTNVFSAPEEINLQRSPNPHVGFGSGPHNCLGAIHTRAILRSLIRNLAEKTSHISVTDSVPNIETFNSMQREVGYARLMVNFQSRC